MKDITIAIDGYSSTGKSTIAKALAKELGFVYVDSGAMYRAITLFAMDNGIIGQGFFNKAQLIEALPNIEVKFEYNSTLNKGEIVLNNHMVEDRIRTLEVSGFVSTIAAVPEVRRKLVEQQKLLGENGGVIMDGRDIGTVVFPNAELKFFMSASAEVRAQRRYKELLEKGESVNYEEVLENVMSRDQIDSTREDSPLVKADDAIEFDNSQMTISEQLDQMLKIIRMPKS